eukprot:jgi/Bigna1/91356/estExt_fgenesh1_pg.C_980021
MTDFSFLLDCGDKHSPVIFCWENCPSNLIPVRFFSGGVARAETVMMGLTRQRAGWGRGWLRVLCLFITPPCDASLLHVELMEYLCLSSVKICVHFFKNYTWSSSDEDARLEFGWGKKIADEAKSIEEKITCCAADVRSSFACLGNKAKQYIGTSLGKGGNDRSESSLKANRESREGHKLLKKRTVASCSSAAEHFKKAFDFDQEPSHLRDAAEALNAVMRMQTNANAICFEGSNDIPRHKNIWKKYGSESEKLASQALKERPKDPEYLATYTDSFIFSCRNWFPRDQADFGEWMRSESQRGYKKALQQHSQQ